MHTSNQNQRILGSLAIELLYGDEPPLTQSDIEAFITEQFPSSNGGDGRTETSEVSRFVAAWLKDPEVPEADPDDSFEEAYSHSRTEEAGVPLQGVMRA